MKTLLAALLLLPLAADAGNVTVRAPGKLDINCSTPADAAVMGPFTNWRMIPGTGDLNGDGMADLCWENIATGQTNCWLMCGLERIEDILSDD